MGLLDSLIDLPGKILEKSVEAVVRSPEIVIKSVEGVAKGIEKGVDKVMDKIDGD